MYDVNTQHSLYRYVVFVDLEFNPGKSHHLMSIFFFVKSHSQYLLYFGCTLFKQRILACVYCIPLS